MIVKSLVNTMRFYSAESPLPTSPLPTRTSSPPPPHHHLPTVTNQAGFIPTYFNNRFVGWMGARIACNGWRRARYAKNIPSTVCINIDQKYRNFRHENYVSVKTLVCVGLSSNIEWSQKQNLAGMFNLIWGNLKYVYKLIQHLAWFAIRLLKCS